MELCARKDVPVNETWDLSLIFKEEKQMWEALEQAKADVKAFVETYAGKLATAETIVNCLDDMEKILPAIGNLWSYTGLAVEADYTDNKLRERDEKIGDEATRLFTDMAFVDSEILLAPEAELNRAVTLAEGCRVYLEDLIAKKAHMLSPETEKVLAALDRSFGVPYDVYNTLKLADIAFDPITVDGKEYPMGYSLYEDDYELEANTTVRRAAFRAFYDTLKKYENTTATAYNACVTQEKVMSELRPRRANRQHTPVGWGRPVAPSQSHQSQSQSRRPLPLSVTQKKRTSRRRRYCYGYFCAKRRKNT